MTYKSRLFNCALCACISIVSINVSASTLYRYTGSTYEYINGSSIVHTFDMAVSSSFILDQPLLPNLQFQPIIPVSFSIFDGVNTVTESTANSLLLYVETDSAGNISDWLIRARIIPTAVHDYEIEITTAGDVLQPYSTVQDTGFYGLCEVIGEDGFCIDTTKLSYALSDVWNGGWTSSPAYIPIPAPLWLFVSGLVGLIGAAKRKVRV